MNGESVHLFSPLHHSFHSFTTHFIPKLLATVFLFSPPLFFCCCPHKRTFWLHSSTFLTFSSPPICPPTPIRVHTYIHTCKRDEKEETHGNMGPATHTLLIISSLTHNHKGTYFEITRLLPFPLCITCNNRNRLKRPAGGFLLLQSAVTSAPITAEHRSVLKVRSVYRQSGAEHLLISACGCVSVAGEVNDMLV